MMMAGSIIGLLALAVATLALLGWVVPVVAGVLLLRKGGGRRAAGVALTVLGGLWLAVGLVVAAGAGLVYAKARAHRVPTPVFAPATHQGPVGHLQLAHAGSGTLTVSPTSGSAASLQTRVQAGLAPLPVGGYRLLSWSLESSTPDGANWSIGGRPGPEAVTVEVKAGERTPVALGPPYRAEVKVSSAPEGSARFDLAVTDVGGHDCTIRGGTGKAAPRVEVVNAAGEVVWQGTFEYG